MNNIDVFISYSHKDKAMADAICHQFEQDKIKCWMAPRDIHPGDGWAESIANAIPKSKMLLLIFSTHSNMSKQVLREVELAITSNLTIVPARIEDIRPTGGMAYYLSTVHWVELMDDQTEKNINNLLGSVKNMLDYGESPLENRNTSINIKKSQKAIISAEKKKHKPQKKPKISKGKTESKNNLRWLYIAAAAVILLGAGLFAFRDSLFNGENTLLDASAGDISTPSPTYEVTLAPTEAPTKEPADEPTFTPSSEPTAEPTPFATATINPQLEATTPIYIESNLLKNCIIESLALSGHQVEEELLYGDILKLKTLVVSAYNYRLLIEGSLYEKCVVNNNDIRTLEGLQYAKNLEVLIFIDQSLEDISALTQCSSLQNVSFAYNNITDISPLQHHPNLYNIDISYIDELTDISSLSVLENLQILNLEQTGVKDLAIVLDFKSLNDLYIRTPQYYNNSETIDELSAQGCNVHYY